MKATEHKATSANAAAMLTHNLRDSPSVLGAGSVAGEGPGPLVAGTTARASTGFASMFIALDAAMPLLFSCLGKVSGIIVGVVWAAGNFLM